ncbi:unnamed protein product [Pedinophyceae sp. YPF-701]|nr:unnamed protein product [Pedinophyceae sp. YPF-701]
MLAHKKLERLQAKLDAICSGTQLPASPSPPATQSPATPPVKQEPPPTPERLDALKARLAALEAKRAALEGATEPDDDADAADDDGLFDDDDAFGGDESDSGGGSDSEHEEYTPGGGAARVVARGGDQRARRVALWRAHASGDGRQAEGVKFRLPRVVRQGGPGLGCEGNAKLCLVAHYCTAADAVLALLGSRQLVQSAWRAHELEGFSGYDVALMAMKDLSVLGDSEEDVRAAVQQTKGAVAHFREAMEVSARKAALSFHVDIGGVKVGAFRRTGGSKSRLCPAKNLEPIVTFERLVLSGDGATPLRLGPGSLLRCLAAGCIAGCSRRELLLMPGGEELRVTPGLLAGLLLQAEDACTPKDVPLHGSGARCGRLQRLRHMYDTYVRPLTSLPDGGGVLLPQARVESWLPGVGWLPMAFCVPKPYLKDTTLLPVSIPDSDVEGQRGHDGNACGSPEAGPSPCAGTGRAKGDGGAPWPARTAALSTDAETKLLLLTSHAGTAADVVQALLGRDGLASASTPTTGPADALERCLQRVADLAKAPRATKGSVRHKVTKALDAIKAHLRAVDRVVRKAALTFKVEAGVAGFSLGAREGPTAPAFCCANRESKLGRLCPSEGVEAQAAFERLVVQDGRLRLGAGSLLRCLATACIAELPGRDLLASDGQGGEFRLTPALLAGLLVEAEDMCTPSARKPVNRLPGSKLTRTRHMFETYVRPLMSQPDGGGVLLPESRLATWLPGVGALPMAFRVGADDVLRCYMMNPHLALLAAGNKRAGPAADAGGGSANQKKLKQEA